MNQYQQIMEVFSQKDAEIERLEESIGQLALKLDELDGWEPIGEFENGDSGPSLTEIKSIASNLRKLTSTNPLLKRGCDLRGSYVFGNGITFREVKPAALAVMDDKQNKRTMFSIQGYEELNRAKYTDGNVFIIFNDKTKRFTRVPLGEIESLITNPDDNEDVWLIKRRWLGNGDQEQQRWYRTDSTASAYKTVRFYDKVAVETNSTIFFESSNKQIGWTFGLPDALAAVLWAKAYSAYLNDNAKLVKAYARFAMKVSAQSMKGVNNTAGELRTRNPGGVGQTAVTGADNDLVAMPATGSQVDFNKGQPLAAMVASSLGVSVIAILSSPGAAGGSYGAAATLDAPTIIGMSAIQDTWVLFYDRVFDVLKSPKAKAEFPAIEKDPTYRTLNTVQLLVEAGILHREEGREIAIDLLDVSNPLKELPDLEDVVRAVQSTSGEQGITNNDGRTDLVSE